VAGAGGSSVVGGGGSSVAGGAGGCSVVGGGGSSVGGGVGGCSVGGGSSVAGDGSLVVGGSASVAGADGSLVPVGDGSRLACSGDSSFVVCEGPSSVGVDVLDVGRIAGEGDTELLALAIRPIPEPTATKPSRTLRTTVSLPTPSSVATCSSTCFRTPGRTRSTTSMGCGMGLSELGANQVRSETAATNATATPVIADTYPRLTRPKRSRRFGRARRAGAFTPRPSLRISFGISFSIKSLLAFRERHYLTCGSGLVDLLVALRRRAATHVQRGAAVLKLEVASVRAVLDDAYLVLGVAGVGITSNPYALV
jgi:hypothetical protein